MIVVKCFGHVHKSKDRGYLIEFYRECMRATRGDERATYAKIICQLVDGKMVCSA